MSRWRVLAVAALLTSAACARRPADDVGAAIPVLFEKGSAQALYDADWRLVRLAEDEDGDRRAERITFYRPDQTPLRREVDMDRDGVIDRWEIFEPSGRLVRVGTSTRRGLRPDLWVDLDAQGAERRREYDDDGDGLPDRAEVWAEGRLVAEEFAIKGDGLFRRRLVRGPDGRVVRVETDDDGDGLFEKTNAVR